MLGLLLSLWAHGFCVCVENESDVDEYLPEQSGSNMVFLERAVEPDHSDHDDEEDFNIASTELLHVDDMTDSGGMYDAHIPLRISLLYPLSFPWWTEPVKQLSYFLTQC